MNPLIRPYGRSRRLSGFRRMPWTVDLCDDSASRPDSDFGAGPDRLVLRISQDAWRGDAQYTVSVDGRQVGGVLTAKALHASGASEEVVLAGDWAAGAHRVEVKFLNDAWAGTPETDRNLYLDGASYNGSDIHGVKAVLLSTGDVASFTVHDQVW